MRALIEGRFAEIEQRAQEALAVGERVQAPDRVQAFGAQMTMLYGQQGRLHEFAPAVIAFVEQ